MKENDIKPSGSGAENKIENHDKQNTIKTIIFITVLFAAVVALTFIFRFAGLIKSIPLKITVIYIIYVAMIALVFIVCRIEKKRVRDLGFSKEKLCYQILIGIGIAVGLSLLVGVLPILIGGSGASLVGEKQTGAVSIVYSIVTALIFIGTLEELIFRGYMQTRINALTKHKFIGVLIAAALFGLWHIINGSWIQVAFAFLIGCVFGFCRAYLKNCSLLSVIIAHGLYDALLVLIGIILL
ncbi:MAG: CPBP family intramembrane metalloprotease [Clostridiales bacterium]|jgi:membrane protease YdiL (CAAX protease family)|nr:CPBP family intramembrane metalloprotease [Clostridiales bacterium]